MLNLGSCALNNRNFHVILGGHNVKEKRSQKDCGNRQKAGYGGIVRQIGDPRREKRIYRIAKTRQREREETGNNDIIKDKEGKMLFDEDKISLRWVEYFEELLNVENKREELIEMYKVEGPEKGIVSKNGEEQVNIWEMNGEELKQVKSFKHLGSLINNKGGCEKEVQARVTE